MQIYRFRNCLLNPAERSVIKDSQLVELTPRTFDVLQFLIENVGRVITKDEILGHVWSGSFVEENNLPVHISKLRRSLGESAPRRFIETIQGVGYRFVAPVHISDAAEWNAATAANRSLPLANSTLSANSNSIAVLPIQNESGDSSLEYLADGLTASLINTLSLDPALRVIARNTFFRYKNKEVGVSELGGVLGVSRVLTGRLRLAGEKIIVAVELI